MLCGFYVIIRNMKVAVFRKTHFNAAHRLHNPEWDDNMNAKIFGKCNNEYYHGHNYDLIVKVVGEVDKRTGYVVDMKVLKDIISEHVLDRFDHKNLNLQVPEFKELNPTAENIAIVIHDILKQHLDPSFELTVTLYETERNFVEYPVH